MASKTPLLSTCDICPEHATTIDLCGDLPHATCGDCDEWLVDCICDDAVFCVTCGGHHRPSAAHSDPHAVHAANLARIEQGYRDAVAQRALDRATVREGY